MQKFVCKILFKNKLFCVCPVLSFSFDVCFTCIFYTPNILPPFILLQNLKRCQEQKLIFKIINIVTSVISLHDIFNIFNVTQKSRVGAVLDFEASRNGVLIERFGFQLVLEMSYEEN